MRFWSNCLCTQLQPLCVEKKVKWKIRHLRVQGTNASTSIYSSPCPVSIFSSQKQLQSYNSVLQESIFSIYCPLFHKWSLESSVSLKLWICSAGGTLSRAARQIMYPVPHTHPECQAKERTSACLICFYCMSDVSRVGAHIEVSVCVCVWVCYGWDAQHVSLCVGVSECVTALPLGVCIIGGSKQGRRSQHLDPLHTSQTRPIIRNATDLLS